MYILHTLVDIVLRGKKYLSKLCLLQNSAAKNTDVLYRIAYGSVVKYVLSLDAFCYN